MLSNILKRFLVIGLLACPFLGWAGSAPKLAVPSAGKGVKIGLVVRDLRSGSVVASQNELSTFTPASILKCVTAAAAIADNRAQQRIPTPSYLSGKLEGATFTGRLVVEGHGDPTNESEYFPDYCGFADSIASRMTSLGIRKFVGTIEIDNSAFPYGGTGEFWDAEDLPWYYGAGLFPLNYRNNTLKPDRAMPNPAERFTTHLSARLRAHGIVYQPSTKASSGNENFPLYTQLSPQLVDIIHSMMVRSDNLFAEAMLRTLSPYNPIDTALQRENLLMDRLGLDSSMLTAYDGSGLTRKNSVTPQFMSDMLTAMARSHYGYEYVNVFPRAGEEGTVEHFLADTPLKGQMVLKSGSMKGVQCFAGYKIDEEGLPTHSVVVMVNNFSNSRRAAVKKAITNFLVSLFKVEPSSSPTPLVVQNP